MPTVHDTQYFFSPTDTKLQEIEKYVSLNQIKSGVSCFDRLRTTEGVRV